MDNKADRFIYQTDKHRVQNDKVNDLREKTEVLNDNQYTVEVANDFSIPVIPSNLVNMNQEMTGYTAGLITRDLVTMGEAMIANKNKQDSKK